MEQTEPAFLEWNLGKLANQSREISEAYGILVRYDTLLNHKHDFHDRLDIATSVLREALPRYLALCPKGSASYSTTPTDPEKLEARCFKIETDSLPM